MFVCLLFTHSAEPEGIVGENVCPNRVMFFSFWYGPRGLVHAKSCEFSELDYLRIIPMGGNYSNCCARQVHFKENLKTKIVLLEET